MDWIKTILIISLFIVFYTLIGYGILLYLLVTIKRIASPGSTTASAQYEPPVTLVIPCFNEADMMDSKISNCRALNYPADKLSIIFITDGSTDQFAEVLQKYPDIRLLHKDHRAGKTAAENRAMQYVTTPIVIFSDANTILNPGAIKNLVKHFANPAVGCVAGEKRILTRAADSASAAGESIYWQYESFLKKLDSALNSTVGAAGELVAFRSSLYKNLPDDTLLDDFMQSMQIAANGYKIVYEPEAFATEQASANIKEELKRKIRIAAGNWQAIKRLSGTLNFTKTPLLYFQYVSHKVLRWSVTPFLLIVIFLFNIPLAISGDPFYETLLFTQVLFYAIAAAGYLLENKNIRFTAFFIPCYFCVMHYAALAGLIKFLSGKQDAAWEKAKRK